MTKLRNFDWTMIEDRDVNKYVDNYNISSQGQFYCSGFPIKVKYISTRQAFNPWINSNIWKIVSYKS